MPIRSLLAETSFDPEQTEMIAKAQCRIDLSNSIGGEVKSVYQPASSQGAPKNRVAFDSAAEAEVVGIEWQASGRSGTVSGNR